MGFSAGCSLGRRQGGTALLAHREHRASAASGGRLATRRAPQPAWSLHTFPGSRSYTGSRRGLLDAGAAFRRGAPRVAAGERSKGLEVDTVREQGSEATASASSKRMDADPDEEASAVPWSTLVSLCTVSSVICTIDRAAMSVAIIPMAEDFDWSDQIKGAVSSAFFGGYTVTNLSGGYLTGLFPAASLLGAGVVMWSLFTVLTPAAAATRSMPALLGCRAAMGISEGVAFPSYTALYAKHVPKARRSVAQALLYSGQQLGTIIALLTAPKIISWGSWHDVFYIFGSLGLAWAMFWAPVALRLDRRQGPEEDESDKQTLAQKISIPWGRIATNPAAASLAVAHCSCGFGLFIYQAWLPSFCAQQYGLGLHDAATIAIGPWLVQSFTTAGAGALADYLIARGTLDRTSARKAMQTGGALIPAALLTVLAVSPPDDVQEGLALLTLCFGALGLQGAGFGGNHADISPKYAGAMFGVTNAMASIFGTLGIYLTGVALEYTDGDWSPTFGIIAITYVIGWAVFMTWGSGDEQNFDAPALK